ncbi:MAG: GNAT family N-acetyltransferase [Chromatiales bacterium]|nr:GNAT family N-acetyltransferase [Chromatiales bacterium]
MTPALTLLPIGRDGSVPATGLVVAGIAAAVAEATAGMYRVTGFRPPWTGYLALCGEQIVGTCAFKAAPSDGAVEIAFFTFPGHEGQGFATAMARQLIDIAYGADRSLKIIAHTRPERNASNAVLSKLGFLLLGDYEDPADGTVWEWEYIR